MTQKTNPTSADHDKAQRNSGKRKRPNAEERAYRWLAREFKSAPKTADGRGFMRFIADQVRPYKERGDHYRDILGECALQFEEGTALEAVPAKLKLALGHLNDLQTDRLNYDDMREALRWILGHCAVMIFIETPEQVVQFLESSGLNNALTGAPASDLGTMRSALRLCDNSLSYILKGGDEKMPREAVMMMWEVIHAARKAICSAAPSERPPDDPIAAIAVMQQELTFLRAFFTEKGK